VLLMLLYMPAVVISFAKQKSQLYSAGFSNVPLCRLIINAQSNKLRIFPFDVSISHAACVFLSKRVKTGNSDSQTSDLTCSMSSKETTHSLSDLKVK
jgi:hypothetical protein